MKLIFSLGQDLFEQFCCALKSPIVSSDKKLDNEIVELLGTGLRQDNVSSTLLHVLHVTLIGKYTERLNIELLVQYSDRWVQFFLLS